MILRGPIPTFYGSNGPEAEVRACEALLRAARPGVVQLHTWGPAAGARRLRALLGDDLQLVVGVGVDSIARAVALGNHPLTRGVAAFLDRAREVVDVGARAIVWNAEANWKRPPNSAEAARLADVITEGLVAVATRYPTLEQHHTAYDHPSWHSTYPWRAWLGPHSRVIASWCQVYAAPGGTSRAHRGALPAREVRALASWGAAVRAGWFAEDDPSTATREGVAWKPYYQLHHVTAHDTVTSALTHDAAMLWALRSRSDVDGRRAFLALCLLDRLGYWRPEGLRDFQRDRGLHVDGVFGPRTETALLDAAGVDAAVLGA